MLLTRLLETIYISSPASRSEFSESDLEKLANLILNASGVINPIVVKQVAPLSFTVVEGHFEFYASLKAKEINPTFEEIQVLILTGDSQTDESISEQIKLLRNKPSNGSSKDNDEYKNLEKLLLDRFSQLETKLNSSLSVSPDIRQIEEFFSKHEERIIALEKHLLDRLSNLEDKIQHLIPPPPPKVCINSASKKELEKIRGLGSASSKKIIERRKTNPFKSINEVFECCKTPETYRQDWQRSFVFD
jgi:hypothetical protein